MPPSQHILAFAQAATRVFPHVMDHPRHCLNATRIGIDALKEFGVAARPMSVTAQFMNKAWYDFLVENQGGPISKEMSDEWAARGGYCIGIDTKAPQQPGNFPGHVVILAQHHLIDASALQFSRPQHGIDLPHVLYTPYPPSFEDGKETAIVGSDNGAIGFYRARPKDRSFFGALGFRKHSGNVYVTELVVTYMRTLLTRT